MIQTALQLGCSSQSNIAITVTFLNYRPTSLIERAVGREGGRWTKRGRESEEWKREDERVRGRDRERVRKRKDNASKRPWGRQREIEIPATYSIVPSASHNSPEPPALSPWSHERVSRSAAIPQWRQETQQSHFYFPILSPLCRFSISLSPTCCLSLSLALSLSLPLSRPSFISLCLFLCIVSLSPPFLFCCLFLSLALSLSPSLKAFLYLSLLLCCLSSLFIFLCHSLSLAMFI